MKIQTKILIGFCILIVLVIFQIITVHNLQSNLYDNTLQLKEVEMPLRLLIQQGISYGTIASEQIYHSILHMQKGEYDLIGGHKATYDAVNIKLTDIFNRDSKILVSKSSMSQEEKEIMTAKFKEIERLNNLMGDLATKSFMAIDKKENDLAFSLVMGGDYERYQQEIQLVVKDLSEEVDKNVLDIENNLLKESQQIIYLNLGVSIGIMIMIIMTMLIIRSFVKEKYQMLYETSRDALMTLEPPKWNFTTGNPAAIRMFNVRDEKQFRSLNPGDLSPEKQPDGQLSSVKSKKMIEKALKEGSNFFKWTHKRYKGRAFSANVLLSGVKIEGKTCIQATVRKID